MGRQRSTSRSIREATSRLTLNYTTARGTNGTFAGNLESYFRTMEPPSQSIRYRTEHATIKTKIYCKGKWFFHLQGPGRERTAATGSSSRRDGLYSGSPQQLETFDLQEANNRQKLKDVTPRKATYADAAWHRIPLDYKLDRWDPAWAPIVIIGAVFDAYQLGKWIYEWCAVACEARQELSSGDLDLAHELWCLLASYAEKTRILKEGSREAQGRDEQETLEDFAGIGKRNIHRLRDLIRHAQTQIIEDIDGETYIEWHTSTKGKAPIKKEGFKEEDIGVRIVKYLFHNMGSLNDIMARIQWWNEH